MFIAVSHDFVEAINFSITPFHIKRGENYHVQGVAKLSKICPYVQYKLLPNLT